MSFPRWRLRVNHRLFVVSLCSTQFSVDLVGELHLFSSRVCTKSLPNSKLHCCWFPCLPYPCAEKLRAMAAAPAPAKRSTTCVEPSAGYARRTPVRTLAAVLPRRHRSSTIGLDKQAHSGHPLASVRQGPTQRAQARSATLGV